jgi:hypothetical protein
MSLVHKINQARSCPASVIARLRRWADGFLDERTYSQGGLLFKLREDRSIIDAAIAYLAGQEPLSGMSEDGGLGALASENARLLLATLKSKSHQKLNVV